MQAAKVQGNGGWREGGGAVGVHVTKLAAATGARGCGATVAAW